MDHRTELSLAVKRYLESQRWTYNERPDNYRFDFSMGIGGKLSSCRMIIAAEDEGVVFLAVSPLNASPDTLPTVAEFITRANYGLKAGNFEMDYSDGEIRYKNYLRCKGSIPAMEDIEHACDICFLMFRRYGNGLVKNLMGFGSPEEDIRDCEK